MFLSKVESKNMVQVLKYNLKKNAFKVLYNFEMQNVLPIMVRIELSLQQIN